MVFVGVRSGVGLRGCVEPGLCFLDAWVWKPTRSVGLSIHWKRTAPQAWYTTRLQCMDSLNKKLTC